MTMGSDAKHCVLPGSHPAKRPYLGAFMFATLCLSCRRICICTAACCCTVMPAAWTAPSCLVHSRNSQRQLWVSHDGPQVTSSVLGHSQLGVGAFCPVGAQHGDRSLLCSYEQGTGIRMFFVIGHTTNLEDETNIAVEAAKHGGFMRLPIQASRASETCPSFLLG